jgi:RNA polymerase sigma factor (sigma-70 family)
MAFCAELHPRLVGALVVSTGDRQLAHDLAQEALCRVVERWDSVRTMASPEGWAFAVAFNLTRSWWRRSARGARAVLRLQGMSGHQPPPPHEAVDDRRWLLDAVAALPPRQRQVIALRFYADCSVRQTAEAMGCAEGTVKSLTAKATGRLRDVLGGEVAIDGGGGA